MITTRFLSQTFALRPNCSWKIPIVPGPQTSWVIRMSTSTQTFSSGETLLRPLCLAKIFSVIVMPGICKTPAFGRKLQPQSIAADADAFYPSKSASSPRFCKFLVSFGLVCRAALGWRGREGSIVLLPCREIAIIILLDDFSHLPQLAAADAR